MLTNKNPRRYEVSLWTLQDSFITVLKSFDTDNLGGIQEPQLTLSDDSEDTFSFKLPMYIIRDGEHIENPIWYNVTNGNLIINLRKIKVVFHKGEPRQRVFEFIITNVTESHEGFEKYCEVECEGLAYNELGKTGYNIELSQDIYEIDYTTGLDHTEICEVKSKYNENDETIYYVVPSQHSELISEVTAIPYDDGEAGDEVDCIDITVDRITYENTIIIPAIVAKTGQVQLSYHYLPLNNINYWLDKVFSSQSKWQYRINMDWRKYPEETRRSDRVYEDAYIENWELNNSDRLTPSSAVESREKYRIVSESGSNRYNLTQSIAETFGVFCRYIYSYDDNLYITGRTVEFYNSALKEQDGIFDFTYYYQTENLSRTMDSADQISKMIVQSGSDEEMLNSSITEVEGNKSLENYLLNFDYMYATGAIDDEQYDYIEEFETTMRKYNQQLQELAIQRTIYEEALTEFQVKRDNANLAAASALEAMEDERAYIKHLLNTDKTDYDGQPETLSVTGINPVYGIIVVSTDDSGATSKSCGITTKGVFPNTIVAFTSLSAAQLYHEALYTDKKQVNIEAVQDNDTTIYTATIISTGVPLTYNGSSKFATLALATQAAQKWALDNVVPDSYLSSSKYKLVLDEQGFAIGLNDIVCDDSLSSIFLAFDYSVDLYHKILAQEWAQVNLDQTEAYKNYGTIVDKINGSRDENNNWLDEDNKGLLQDCIDEYNEILELKQLTISEFEDYMGAALREGTWQPEDDYAKYSNNKQINLSLTGNAAFDDETEVSIGWDEKLFDGEESNYYKYGVKQEKIYYPCIKLTEEIITAINEAIEDSYSEEETLDLNDFGFIWDDTAVPGINPLITSRGVESIELNYPQSYKIGSEAEIAFLKSLTDEDEPAFPVLMLTKADSYCSTFDLINNTGASQTDILKSLNGCIGRLYTEQVQLESGLEGDIEIKYVTKVLSPEVIWIDNNNLKDYVRVYPRIRIANTKFVNNTEDCILYADGDKLTAFNDYLVTSRYDIDGDNISTDLDFWLDNDSIGSAQYAYYVTIKPEAIIRNDLQYGDYRFFYKLSNTGLAIYLDAIQVLKENSVPKVTYEITPMIFDAEFIETEYNRIHQIIHINDPELKFENVQGYISKLTLDLDQPQEDSIEVQNYTTKFEDLFSSIVASTEAIRKNSAVISTLSQAFVSTGEISEKTLQRSMNLADITLKYNNDNFIINDSGIKGYSANGIVQFTNQGIFTASKKDDDGNWIWNTSIRPTGINANAITAGQLDTNLIRIYSGSDLRFQMNSEGLFAYKSWLSEDLGLINNTDDKTEIEESIVKRDGLDPAQYVVMNSEGLFLKAKKGAYLLDNDKGTSTKLDQDVDRVEISWDGLKLRNNKNEETLYADPDTGNLNIAGNVIIKGTNMTAEFSESKLRFENYELVRMEANNSEYLSFVYYFYE